MSSNNFVLSYKNLTSEQQKMIDLVREGKNVLVDACIGSGKTTAIQALCNELFITKKILYLTYNKLLKLDAKNKIRNKNVTTTNYHGFAYGILIRNNIKTSGNDAIKDYLETDIVPGNYDILVLDEYQDINTEISDLLTRIKEHNPNIQIVAVGDMDQKIYDSTTLKADEFINNFLVNYEKISFTQSFKMPKEHGAMLGRVWNKNIVGVNENCEIEYKNKDEIIQFLSTQDPKDILCLGSRRGLITEVLNELENNYPEKFNKKTVYASIRDEEKMVEPKKDSAIFTTFDSSKGLERPICVVFDWSYWYYGWRLQQYDTNPTIIKNIFAVAASRGKRKIIFLNEYYDLLNEHELKNDLTIEEQLVRWYRISDMFEHKFSEHLTDVYNCLEVDLIDIRDNSTINIKQNDYLIDLSPCIGIYQEASYFNSYNIKKEIEFQLIKGSKWEEIYKKDFVVQRDTVNDLILFLTAMETNQMRYIKQAATDFVNEHEKKLIHNRISTMLGRNEIVQEGCGLVFRNHLNNYGMRIFGLADVVKDDTVYELKFVNELSQNNFLQTAMYMFALNLDKGILWNVKNNTAYNIKIKDKNDFANKVALAISKGNFKIDINNINYDAPWIKNDYKKGEYGETITEDSNIAVIDVETNFFNEVVSIGVAIADKNNFKLVDQNYWLIGEREQSPSMYSNVYHIPELEKYGIKDYVVNTYEEAVGKLIEFLDYYNISDLFSYTKYDYNHLPELHNLYKWFDISIPARNVNTNDFIPKNSPTHKSGALIRNWGVEPTYRLLSGNNQYSEVHNALLDAIDELKIMQMLELTHEGFVTNSRIKRITKNDESAYKIAYDKNLYKLELPVFDYNNNYQASNSTQISEVHDEYVASEKHIFVESNYVIAKNSSKTEYRFDNYVQQNDNKQISLNVTEKNNPYTNQILTEKNLMLSEDIVRSENKHKPASQADLNSRKSIKESLKKRKKENSQNDVNNIFYYCCTSDFISSFNSEIY
ncbi:AAA family ATPase [Mycoplasmopsis agalactiae]|uniref:AAA family ATPase n=1 Tax=Mycoplasmopsis agalactiae TaxID=2110 RepID=UPI002F3EF14D